MNTSLSLSFELIYLMGWLLKNEKTTLNALVKHAIKNGLGKDLKTINPDDYSKVSDQLYSTILDFLVYLEEALAKNLDNIKLETSTSEDNLSTLNIENDVQDINNVKLNIHQTKADISKEIQKRLAGAQDPDQVKKLLYEHIIKNWKPTKNEPMN